MAITKERKEKLISQYTELMKRSEGMIITEYSGMNMKQIDELRGKVREAGGEFHIAKNTLSKKAFSSAGIPVPSDLFEGSTAIVFAFKDAAGMSKIMVDVGRTMEMVKIKGGFLGDRAITADQVKELSNLPPLPVVRSQLMGTILAPANQLVRTLAEPGRSLAAVLKAFVDKENPLPVEQAA